MRVALVNEGTYPVVHGGVSTWCDQLVRTLPDHEFTVVTLTGSQRASVWDLPDNVTTVQTVPMWDPARRRWGSRTLHEARDHARVEAACAALWAAVLPPAAAPADLPAARAALQVLAEGFAQPLLWHLHRGAGTKALMDAWSRHRVGTSLPSLSGARAAEVSRHVDRTLAVLDARWPQVDVVHVTSNGPAGLMALGEHWRRGTPLVMTEHGVHLRERYLALKAAGLPWVVRYALMSLARVVCRLAYDACELITPVSRFNARWEERAGAPAERVVTVPNGVDTQAFSRVDTEPDRPTVTFVGRVDPLKDLATLLGAFAQVHQAVPDALLRIFGPVPAGNEAYHAELLTLVESLGLGGCVTFDGPTPGARPAIEAGHVVALSSISEGLPYTVIESMMCGRATVSTDVGGVSECVGTDESCGLLVPPRDPGAMAAALTRLLLDDDRRHAMGRAARERALEMFDLDTFAHRYRLVYEAGARRVAPHALPAIEQVLTATSSPQPGRSPGIGVQPRPARRPLPALATTGDAA